MSIRDLQVVQAQAGRRTLHECGRATRNQHDEAVIGTDLSRAIEYPVAGHDARLIGHRMSGLQYLHGLTVRHVVTMPVGRDNYTGNRRAMPG